MSLGMFAMDNEGHLWVASDSQIHINGRKYNEDTPKYVVGEYWALAMVGHLLSRDILTNFVENLTDEDDLDTIKHKLFDLFAMHHTSDHELLVEFLIAKIQKDHSIIGHFHVEVNKNLNEIEYSESDWVVINDSLRVINYIDEGVTKLLIEKTYTSPETGLIVKSIRDIKIELCKLIGDLTKESVWFLGNYGNDFNVIGEEWKLDNGGLLNELMEDYIDHTFGAAIESYSGVGGTIFRQQLTEESSA